ncbi:hypothetical protein SNEBB_001276 [Seison nebaliae]|nr:hypothetical protein SNEBB_001276 [Seison nebaliae]
MFYHILSHSAICQRSTSLIGQLTRRKRCIPLLRYLAGSWNKFNFYIILFELFVMCLIIGVVSYCFFVGSCKLYDLATKWIIYFLEQKYSILYLNYEDDEVSIIEKVDCYDKEKEKNFSSNESLNESEISKTARMIFNEEMEMNLMKKVEEYDRICPKSKMKSNEGDRGDYSDYDEMPNKLFRKLSYESSLSSISSTLKMNMEDKVIMEPTPSLSEENEDLSDMGEMTKKRDKFHDGSGESIGLDNIIDDTEEDDDDELLTKKDCHLSIMNLDKVNDEYIKLTKAVGPITASKCDIRYLNKNHDDIEEGFCLFCKKSKERLLKRGRSSWKELQ